MINYGDDAFATMLLTVSLSADRAEYARPLNTQEYRRLLRRVKASSAGRLGALLHRDISGIMMLLDIPEEEAYRAYTLLNRGVQLSYALENFLAQGIRIVTCFDEEYPSRLRVRLGESAPPSLFLAGERDLLNRPGVALLGIRGVKTTPEVRQSIESIVLGASKMGLNIVTGGELGVSRAAAAMVVEHGGTLVDVTAGELSGHLRHEEIRALLDAGRAEAMSLEHPEALFTLPHAIARNRLIFALSQAAFVFSTDGKRGESEALKNHRCEWIYAYRGCGANHALISRGAQPFDLIRAEDFAHMAARWKDAGGEQLSLLDLF